MAARSSASEAEPAERVAELVRSLERHLQLYHLEDAPEISDAEYDALFRELQELEAEWAHERAILHDHLLRKDEMLWELVSAAPSAAVNLRTGGTPPRIPSSPIPASPMSRRRTAHQTPFSAGPLPFGAAPASTPTKGAAAAPTKLSMAAIASMALV